VPQAVGLIDGLKAQVVRVWRGLRCQSLPCRCLRPGGRRGDPQWTLTHRQASLRPAALQGADLIECCLSRLKQFHRVALRKEQTGSYLAVVTPAATIRRLHQVSTLP